jgi:hypothetical protein
MSLLVCAHRDFMIPRATCDHPMNIIGGAFNTKKTWHAKECLP